MFLSQQKASLSSGRCQAAVSMEMFRLGLEKRGSKGRLCVGLSVCLSEVIFFLL